MLQKSTASRRHVQPDELFERYAESRDAAVRNDIVVAYLPLAYSLAVRFSHRGEPLEDLKQVAAIGLMKAVESFERPRGGSFLAYACPTIVGEMKRYLRDKNGLIRIPRRLVELGTNVKCASDTLAFELGRAPRPDEIAAKVQVPVERVLEVQESVNYAVLKSLDAVDGDEAGKSSAPSQRALGANDPDYGHTDDRLFVRAALDLLQPRQRAAVILTFYFGMTQVEVARRICVSQMHVSRLIRRSLKRMHAYLVR